MSGLRGYIHWDKAWSDPGLEAVNCVLVSHETLEEKNRAVTKPLTCLVVRLEGVFMVVPYRSLSSKCRGVSSDWSLLTLPPSRSADRLLIIYMSTASWRLRDTRQDTCISGAAPDACYDLQ